MQIPSIPPPLITNTLPQDVAAKAVSNVQATAPLIHRPVSAPPKSERSHENRRNKEDPRGGERGDAPEESSENEEKRGTKVDFDV